MRLIDGEYTININGINHWIKIDGGKNKTIPLILLHGGPGGNHYTFERTTGPLLASRRTVIYYEQRGCGRSEKSRSVDEYTIYHLIEDFRELKKWIGTEKVDLLGYSFGGELALEIAYALKGEINNIVLSAPSLMTSDVQKMVQITGILSVANKELYSKLIQIPMETLTIAEAYNKFWNLIDIDTVDSLLFENRDIAKRNRKLWEESNLINTGHMMTALITYPINPPLINRLNEIQNRSLILTGIFDRNTGLSISKIIHRELSESQWVLFNESAHFPDLEETNKFVSFVINFLDS
ncbi:alpha/beta fold hydrolase [Pseudalkalibacillus decolorationis]|uniref:alpha/beta fold hydrolase n=1 Tax=Pseudalkalibacillus decolorationis TaxID=163879 RepID=UPI0021492CCB|nr:alpha/beta fold hydrolase [Pseudalkalibacillus decolorationis]